ncbi:MAG: mini-ribonuclease [Clostridiales bacterium]|jgi:ribonuclease-3 family protein|nr:mini-ribonuclease [Clostridiales bacterium]
MKEHMELFLEHLKIQVPEDGDVRMMNALKLAYLGDAIYEAYIRIYLMSGFRLSPHQMSVKAVTYVSAAAQAKIVNTLRDFFTEDEWGMIRRGRNQKPNSMPKNASMSDYRYATGFESLVGYLYLTGSEQRLSEIVAEGIRVIEEPPQSEDNEMKK